MASYLWGDRAVSIKGRSASITPRYYATSRLHVSYVAFVDSFCVHRVRAFIGIRSFTFTRFRLKDSTKFLRYIIHVVMRISYLYVLDIVCVTIRASFDSLSIAPLELGRSF